MESSTPSSTSSVTFPVALSLSPWARLPGLSACHCSWLWFIARYIRAFSPFSPSLHLFLCPSISDFFFLKFYSCLSLSLIFFLSFSCVTLVFSSCCPTWDEVERFCDRKYRPAHQSGHSLSLDVSCFHRSDWWLFNKLRMHVFVSQFSSIPPCPIAACCIVLWRFLHPWSVIKRSILQEWYVDIWMSSVMKAWQRRA